MICGDRIMEQICEELIKTPNVRHVCKKVGIDHSTFYRWIATHHEFSKSVTYALSTGRDNMNDAGEAVIIAGIQKGDLKSALIWLKHNSPRYSGSMQRQYLKERAGMILEILGEAETKDPREMSFDHCFDIYYKLESIFGPEEGRRRVDALVKYVIGEDLKLEPLFYNAYSEWKTSTDALKKIRENAHAQLGTLTSPVNPSSIKNGKNSDKRPSKDSRKRPHRKS